MRMFYSLPMSLPREISTLKVHFAYRTPLKEKENSNDKEHLFWVRWSDSDLKLKNTDIFSDHEIFVFDAFLFQIVSSRKTHPYQWLLTISTTCLLNEILFVDRLLILCIFQNVNWELGSNVLQILWSFMKKSYLTLSGIEPFKWLWFFKKSKNNHGSKSRVKSPIEFGIN
jgi:hypothetical protein